MEGRENAQTDECQSHAFGQPFSHNSLAGPGVALAHAAQRKSHHTYPELGRARRCRLIVFGIEVGGRWAPEKPRGHDVCPTAPSRPRCGRPTAPTSGRISISRVGFAVERHFGG